MWEGACCGERACPALVCEADPEDPSSVNPSGDKPPHHSKPPPTLMIFIVCEVS